MRHLNKSKFFRHAFRVLALLIVISCTVPFTPLAESAGDCTAPPSNPHFIPDSTTAPKGQAIGFKIDVDVICPTGFPAAGYKAKLFLLEAGGSTIDYLGDLPFPGYTQKPNGVFSYSITGRFTPFNDEDKTRNFRATAYPPNGRNGYSGSVVKMTEGAAPPGNNAPPGNGCTGEGCGTVTNSDFDTAVGNLFNPINIDSFPELILFVMKGLIFLIGIMSVLVIIVGGVRMVLSQGNQESVTKGKQTVIWAVAGLIIALLSFSVVSIVQNLLSKPGT